MKVVIDRPCLLAEKVCTAATLRCCKSDNRFSENSGYCHFVSRSINRVAGRGVLTITFSSLNQGRRIPVGLLRADSAF